MPFPAVRPLILLLASPLLATPRVLRVGNRQKHATTAFPEQQNHFASSTQIREEEQSTNIGDARERATWENTSGHDDMRTAICKKIVEVEGEKLRNSKRDAYGNAAGYVLDVDSEAAFCDAFGPANAEMRECLTEIILRHRFGAGFLL